MNLLCLDLEGVLIPEIWINFAEKTGIEALRATTRDQPDYDILMKQRLQILRDHDLRLTDIQAVIADMAPLAGAKEFLGWARERFQVVILSDTFYEFAMPMMQQLGYPTLLCHKLVVDDEGNITDYRLRQKDPKRAAIKAFHGLNYRIFAAGDSYNDTSMLAEADAGALIHAPQNVIDEFPQFTAVDNYEDLKSALLNAEASQTV